MRRPTIRLGYVLELVAATALGFALVRWNLLRRNAFVTSGPARAHEWIVMAGGSFLTGLATVGALGLATEAIRGRRSAPWGLGRWIWSIAGLYMLARQALLIVYMLISRTFNPARPPLRVDVLMTLPAASVRQFLGDFGLALAAVCITAMFARSPRDPEPDAREWAGRIFASLVIAVGLAEQLLQAAGQ